MHTEVLPDLDNKSRAYGDFGKNWKIWYFAKYQLKSQKLPGRKINCHLSNLECQANRGVETLSVVVI